MFDFFCFKQKTAYDMRISDWSSDVCSSDLIAVYGSGRLVMIAWVGHPLGGAHDVAEAFPDFGAEHRNIHIAIAGLIYARGDAGGVVKIGRASCRERVCQYV